jgi:adenine/guanine phosphoribosyltransferase-like PRPP-binding protein
VRQKETSNLTELLRKRALTNTDQLQRVEDRICDHGIVAPPKGGDALKVMAGDDIEVCVDTEGECCSTNKLGLKDEKIADADKDNEVGNGNKSVNGTFKKKELRSRIDDDKLIDLELADYWKSLDNAFQIGHVERGDTHFEHYDKPERLLFRRRTLFELEAYIKEFVWSYKEEEIHYIIYNWDLTAALLAHIVASRFLRKPKVIEAVKFSDGSLVLPSAISKDLNKKNVLLVDDAINTGTTMLELIGLIRIYGGNVAGIFTITNRTSPEVEMTLKNLVPKVACAYRFDLATYRRSRCNLCAYQNLIEAKIRSSATKDFFEYLNSKLNVMAVKPFEM